MISYRKASVLRVERSTEPLPPFFPATTVLPYGGRRDSPLSIDFSSLSATATDRSEVRVADDAPDLLSREDRSSPLRGPVLVESSGYAEAVYRRGEAVARYCTGRLLPTIQLVSTRGDVPRFESDQLAIAVAAWPLETATLEALFRAAGNRSGSWGVVVPVIFPVTTELGILEQLAALAAANGARFLTAFTPELDTAARSALAALARPEDEESYHELFEGHLETISLATERHIASLASERGMADWILAPDSNERTNWNAAAMLARCADRLMRARDDVELAWEILRSARNVARLGKPLARISEAASLSIVDGLDEISFDMLEQWLGGAVPDFAAGIDREWRLRRDHGL